MSYPFIPSVFSLWRSLALHLCLYLVHRSPLRILFGALSTKSLTPSFSLSPDLLPSALSPGVSLALPSALSLSLSLSFLYRRSEPCSFVRSGQTKQRVSQHLYLMCFFMLADRSDVLCQHPSSDCLVIKHRSVELWEINWWKHIALPFLFFLSPFPPVVLQIKNGNDSS